jgi:OPA family glycerol-3-phosphate transporter-like MFS transporter
MQLDGPDTDGAPAPARGFTRSQILTLALLTLGYAGYYFCRANFSVAKPLLIEELSAGGKMTADQAKVALGGIASLATFAYAFGKFVSGSLADFWGGRRNFLLGMVGAILATVLFASGGTIPIFTLAWMLNRTVQSLGWPGAVKISSRWFAYSTYGAAMGVISVSFLFGDAASKALYGALIGQGVGWRGLYYAGAAILGVIFVACLLLLHESPRDTGQGEPPVNPDSVFKADADKRAGSLSELLLPLLRSRTFILVCVLSMAFTLVRETFNEWTSTYFVEFALLSKAEAARRAGLFPLLGGVSVILAGALSDRLGKAGRATITLVGLAITAGLLAALGVLHQGAALPATLIIALVGFVMIGPYSYLAGAVALDFGGRRGAATASGIIDGMGYLASILAGKTVADLSVWYGWTGAFYALSGVTVVALIAAGLYWKDQRP